MIEESQWGFYNPSIGARWIFRLMRLGMGLGKMKKILQRAWGWFQDSKVADVSRYGIKWRLDFSDNVTDGKILFATKEYDRHEIAVLSKACAGGMFVDIGANTGYYALRLAKSGATVLAFEPNPTAYRRLLFNIKSNAFAEKITVLPIGVGEEGEHLLSFGDLGSGSIVGAHNTSHQITVHISPLVDILVAQNVHKIDALKIDIEGAEDLALAPFFQTAKRSMWPSCIVIEVIHRRYWRTDIMQQLLECGYRQISKTRANIILQLSPARDL